MSLVVQAAIVGSIQIIQAILSRYTSGERDFRHLELDGCVHDFENCNLQGAVFTGSFLLASFRNAVLEGADFSACNVKACDFSGAKLAGVSFRKAAIDAAIFTGADLHHTDFGGAHAYDYVFAQGEQPDH